MFGLRVRLNYDKKNWNALLIIMIYSPCSCSASYMVYYLQTLPDFATILAAFITYCVLFILSGMQIQQCT